MWTKFADAAQHANAFFVIRAISTINPNRTLDGSMPANPVNERQVANAVTLKSTFYPPLNQQLLFKKSDYGTFRKVESKYLSVKYLLKS